MITIKDIANRAKISMGAVSRILNNDSTLHTTEETRELVFKIASELGYQKRAYKNKARFKLGIVQWLSNQDEQIDSYYLNIRQGIEDYCIKNFLNVVRAYKTDINCYSQLAGVDGIICIGKFSQKDINHFKTITQNLILLDMTSKDYSTTQFSLNFKDAVYQAMDYLKELGHTKICLLTGCEYVSTNEIFKDERVVYFKKYCRSHGLSYENNIFEGVFTIESGYQMMKEVLKLQDHPTAVFACSDNLALGALKAIQESGLSVPSDISIIGFDDATISKYTFPPLTTFHAPSYEMGEYGVNFLYGSKNLTMTTPISVKMHCYLVERESCKKIN